MTKKIIAGALSIATVVSSFAVLGGMTFAASDGWHQVTVTPESDLVLGGTVANTFTLEPTIEAIDDATAGALTVSSTEDWIIQWQAVSGLRVAESTTGAAGTNLGIAGFAGSGGYAYKGSQATATPGTNNWGVVLAVSGGSLVTTPLLETTLEDVAHGTATISATLTPTYSAGTDGGLGTTSYYGTIYYSLIEDI